MKPLKPLQVGILGFGKMGEALFQGLQKSGKKDFQVTSGTVRSEEKARELSKKYGIQVHTENLKCARESDVLFLAVKPNQAGKVLTSISKSVRPGQIVISVCASIPLSFLRKNIGPMARKVHLLRAMPNTSALIQQGMTVIAKDDETSREALEVASDLFSVLGRVSILDESLMDGVTGLSGCGPAYVYLIIEALSEAGVKVGIPRETATLLAAQTLMGASQMVLTRGIHPAALKDEVTTPAGCTIDGLMALEDGKLRVTLIKAVLAAAKKSRTLHTEQKPKK